MASQNPLGFQAKNFLSAAVPGQLDAQASLWNTSRHGKYYASAYGKPLLAGSAFRCSNPGATPVTLSAGLATTYVGLCISNPAGSTVNLVLRKAAGVIIVAPAAQLALGLITGWSSAGVVTHTTSLTSSVINGYVGAAASSGSIVGPASQAKVDSACTIVGTPAWDRWLAAGIATTDNVSFSVDLDDDTIIPPGGYAAIGASVAGPASGFLGTFHWEELAP